MDERPGARAVKLLNHKRKRDEQLIECCRDGGKQMCNDALIIEGNGTRKCDIFIKFKCHTHIPVHNYYCSIEINL